MISSKGARFHKYGGCVFAAAIAMTLFLLRGAEASVPGWIEDIRPDHPRLFFNSDMMERVRERALTAEEDFYARVRRHADTDHSTGEAGI